MLIHRGIEEIGLQIRASKEAQPSPDRNRVIQLKKRRAGIEPLIGHLKQGWQMGNV